MNPRSVNSMNKGLILLQLRYWSQEKPLSMSPSCMWLVIKGSGPGSPCFRHLRSRNFFERGSSVARIEEFTLNTSEKGRRNGSGIDWFRADLWSCCLDYLRIISAVLGNDWTSKSKTDAAAARRRRCISGLAVHSFPLREWKTSSTRDQASLQLAPIAGGRRLISKAAQPL